MSRKSFYFYFADEEKARKFAEKEAERIETNGTVGLFDLKEDKDGVLITKNCISAW